MPSLFFFLVLIFPAFLSAQVPTFSAEEFSCQIEEFEDGCFGVPVLNELRQLRRRPCKRIARRRVRSAKRQRRRDNRNNDGLLFDVFTTRIEQLLAAARSECDACWFYEDLSCEGESSGGGGGSGSGGGTGGGGESGGGSGGGEDGFVGNNPSISESCAVIGNPNVSSSSMQLQSFVPRIANGVICSTASATPVIELTSSGQTFCSGTLIDGNTVITAAHCFDRINSTNGLAVALSNGQSIAMQSFVANPSWSGGNSNFGDVAIVKLVNSFNGINFASIYVGSSISVGDPVVMAGYGDSPVGVGTLQATVNTIEKIDSTRIETFYQLGNSNEGSSCVGDSGGPLFTFIDGDWKIIGVLSTGGPSSCLLNSGDGSFDESQWTNLNGSNNMSFINANR